MLCPNNHQQATEHNNRSSSAGNRAWGPDLDAYITTHPEDAPSGVTAERQRLIAGVKATPDCADAWRALLAYEEAHLGNLTQHQQRSSGAADSGRVSLYHLYVHATKLVPRSKKEAYLQLWLGYARQAW